MCRRSFLPNCGGQAQRAEEETIRLPELDRRVPAAAPLAAKPTSVAWSEREDERAAIVEFEAGIPRAWAEAFARHDPNCPFGDVSPERWQRYIDDMGRLLDAGLTEKASAFGWSPFDLFGCDCDRAFADIDQQSLCWLLDGHRLVALTVNTATIEIRPGARQTYRLKASEPGRILTWELVA